MSTPSRPNGDDESKTLARRIELSNRNCMLVYACAGVAVSVFCPVELEAFVCAWSIVGLCMLGIMRITPPDHDQTGVRFWVEHLKMVLAWPLLLYWVYIWRARVTRRQIVPDASKDDRNKP
jgi:hypothetical protein